MSLRTRVLAVVGALGALCLAFYLGTRCGPLLLDVALPTLTPSAWNEESYGDGKSS